MPQRADLSTDMVEHGTDSLDYHSLSEASYEGALGVLGHPVSHSLSPAMHNAALQEMAVQYPQLKDWRYWRLPVPPEELPQALTQLWKAGFKGLNLTIPHKVQAVSLCHKVDPAALALGAVNTLVSTKYGWHGYNTDGYGIEQAIKTDLRIDLENTRVLLLGAGGAARAIAAQCLIRKCAELWIANRDQQRLSELLHLLTPHTPQGVTLRGLPIGTIPDDLRKGQVLVINATALGLKPTDPPPVDCSIFAQASIYDTTYGPHESALVTQARARGFPASNGLAMLAWQGARALEIWTQYPVPATTMKTAALASLRS